MPALGINEDALAPLTSVNGPVAVGPLCHWYVNAPVPPVAVTERLLLLLPAQPDTPIGWAVMVGPEETKEVTVTEVSRQAPLADESIKR